jgi:hypothetical protein
MRLVLAISVSEAASFLPTPTSGASRIREETPAECGVKPNVLKDSL